MSRNRTPGSGSPGRHGPAAAISSRPAPRPASPGHASPAHRALCRRPPALPRGPGRGAGPPAAALPVRPGARGRGHRPLAGGAGSASTASNRRSGRRRGVSRPPAGRRLAWPRGDAPGGARHPGGCSPEPRVAHLEVDQHGRGQQIDDSAPAMMPTICTRARSASVPTPSRPTPITSRPTTGSTAISEVLIDRIRVWLSARLAASA